MPAIVSTHSPVPIYATGVSAGPGSTAIVGGSATSALGGVNTPIVIRGGPVTAAGQGNQNVVSPIPTNRVPVTASNGTIVMGTTSPSGSHLFIVAGICIVIYLFMRGL